MSDIFFKMIEISIMASWLIVAVIILRFLLKKAPKNYFCILWGIVAIRLICPFTIESKVGVVPEVQITTESKLQEHTNISEEVKSESNQQSDVMIPPSILENPEDVIENPKIPMMSKKIVVTIVWISGMVIFLLYSTWRMLKLHWKVSASLSIDGSIYICDEIRSPFILGMFSPKIYVPSDLSEEQMKCVIAHEKTHLKRLDHYWKPIGFLLLILYWFNPFAWIAYMLFCRDVEMACDEAVIQKMNHSEKKFYLQTLLFCSNGQYRKWAYPLAFGEIGMKERVKFMVRYKKPSLIFMVIVAMICVTVVACFGTSPSSKKDSIEEGYSILEYEENEDGTLKVVGLVSVGDGEQGHVKIPSSYNGKAVTTIGEKAFYKNEEIFHVTIPDSIITIEESAFEKCYHLESIEIPNSVTTIEPSAFSSCVDLKEVKLSNHLTTIEEYVFKGCNSLEKIEIPSSVTTIGYHAFWNAGNGPLEIPDSVTNIAVYAFLDSNFSPITIPDSVTNIGVGAFVNRKGKETIILVEVKSEPDTWDNGWCTVHNVSKYGNANVTWGYNPDEIMEEDTDKEYSWLFYEENEDGTLTVVGLKNFRSKGIVKIPSTCNGKTVTVIGERAFYKHKGIQKVEMPDSITIIEKEAFAGCENMTEISISANLVTVEERAFVSCKKLQGIKMDYVTKIGTEAFTDCKMLKEVIWSPNLEYVGTYAFGECYNLEHVAVSELVTNVNVTEQVRKIDNFAFMNCNKLKNIEIPFGITSIGNHVFWNSGSESGFLEIPSSVTTIKAYAFLDSHFSYIIIPSSVITIENGAFVNTTTKEKVLYVEEESKPDTWEDGWCTKRSVGTYQYANITWGYEK